MSHWRPRVFIRRLGLTLAMVAVAIVSSTPVVADGCQYCHTGGEVGQCYDVLTPNPGLMTLTNCEGTRWCYRWPGGELCVAKCLGNQCYWV
jgi:hypothetical protein